MDMVDKAATAMEAEAEVVPVPVPVAAVPPVAAGAAAAAAVRSPHTPRLTSSPTPPATVRPSSSVRARGPRGLPARHSPHLSHTSSPVKASSRRGEEEKVRRVGPPWPVAGPVAVVGRKRRRRWRMRVTRW